MCPVAPMGEDPSLACVVNLAAEQLSTQRPLMVRPRGRSMWPRVRQGVETQVLPCIGGDVRLGDVVCFRRDQVLVLHRVVREGASHVLVKGDAMTRPDGWIRRDQVLGRLAARTGDRWVARLSMRYGARLAWVGKRVRGFFDHRRAGS